ncbi:MAG: DUF1850 domain-containing protein [Candidatus Accumulibacter sp.]|uniref:DUF1850 domain-containing protein n=1 Tax=Accumulibacter sp. TaxID=2053492 RepID=UPI0019EFD4DE|nr:DUF1850 domain-containing protein [Accumulibacter sp.]MBE2258507.1 DUF1850 domain-containing protein [Paracoccaceae bacterium]MCB1941983.1 DUF1850 domain-containing protein [Accumulibacter sp.]MCP5249953.1 DUF1850 domain-containing protein [Accumulibacter sp.]
MALCLASAAASVLLASNAFTLGWTHSIEKIRWEEDWIVRGNGLVLESVRVRGHGAGMEPPAGAVLRDGVWQWHPRSTHDVLRLSRSEYTSDYDWCADGSNCVSLAALLPADGDVTEVRPCTALRPTPFAVMRQR